MYLFAQYILHKRMNSWTKQRLLVTAWVPWKIGPGPESAEIVDEKSGTESDPFFRGPFELYNLGYFSGR